MDPACGRQHDPVEFGVVSDESRLAVFDGFCGTELTAICLYEVVSLNCRAAKTGSEGVADVGGIAHFYGISSGDRNQINL
jgi:hypothetical protein